MIDPAEALRERARVAAARGDLGGAVAALRAAASQTHAPEREYLGVLRPFADILARSGDPRGALTVASYLVASDPAEWVRVRALLPQVPPGDRARAMAAQGQTTEAAREAETAGLVATAALYREMGGEWVAARALWTRLAATMAVRAAATESDRYTFALVEFNRARCARRCEDTSQAREATVACVRLLEEAADHFEAIGQRERAFDCFHVLAHVGRTGGAFENVLEGYVNCIRILREDRMKYFALQHYDEAIAAAVDKAEIAAAATLAREASDYARGLGLAAIAASHALRQAELWRLAAKKHLERGAPVEMTENALLASVLAFGELGQATKVGELYGELATLDRPAARREHYARAARRYASWENEPIEVAVASDETRRNTNPEVWRADVLEWERAGSAAEACADIMADARLPDFVRRKAMLARLTALAVEETGVSAGLPGPADDVAVATRVRLAGELAQLQLYAVLSPLEHLFARPEPDVRLAVLAAVETLFFKRSFLTVRAGLADGDSSVAARASTAIEALVFEQGYDPLARLAQSADAGVRASAIRAIARIDTGEAAEFLLGVLGHGARSDRTAATEALKAARGAHFIELAREALAAPPRVNDANDATLRGGLQEILGWRGFVAGAPRGR